MEGEGTKLYVYAVVKNWDYGYESGSSLMLATPYKLLAEEKKNEFQSKNNNETYEIIKIPYLTD